MPGRRCGVIFHQSLAEARDLGTAAMLPTRTSIRNSRERSGVKYNEGAELDPSQMGGGGRGNGGKIAVGGGAGLIVLLLALLLAQSGRHPRRRRRRDRSRRATPVRSLSALAVRTSTKSGPPIRRVHEIQSRTIGTTLCRVIRRFRSRPFPAASTRHAEMRPPRSGPSTAHPIPPCTRSRLL